VPKNTKVIVPLLPKGGEEGDKKSVLFEEIILTVSIVCK